MSQRSKSPVVWPVTPYSLFVAISVILLLLWGVTITTVKPGRVVEPHLDAARSVPKARLISDLSELEFGTVRVGERVTRRLLLTNSSLDDMPITVSAVWLSEPDARVFVTDFTSPRTLLAGDSLVIEIGFAPEAAGHRVGALYVSHDGESNMDIYTLSGNGLGANASVPELGEAHPVTEPAFGKSDLSGFSGVKPTSLQFGPDGRLYVADMLGLIKVLEIERKGANDYRVLSQETISLIRDIPNHDDDGKPNTAIKKRLITGLLVSGTPSSPIVYVASSDPRIGGGPSHTETGLDTNSGVVSRLSRTASGHWQKLDLVRGLSRSEENHHVNGMVLNESTQRLYVGAGGNTNAGGPSNNFAMLPEFALSAAILEIDLDAIGDTTYDLPTLDDETRPGVHDQGDPFGGNDGRNQAKLVPNGPVTVYAPGFRNPYDLVLTDEGRLYTIDNGGNAGWGGPPKGEGTKGNCTNAQSEPGATHFDSLHLISGRGYYGGHPNPTRANQANTFNKTKPQSPVSEANPVECDFRGAGGKAALTSFGFSTNGLAEYRASNFGSAMKGDLLAAAWNNSIQRIVLDAQGKSVTDKEALFANVGGLPLDVTAQGDAQRYPGTIWVADFVKKDIVVFEPVDYKGAVAGVCGGTPSEDDDKDGFSNVDELANGTNPCSAADLPADLDNDFLSDRIDTDDDDDGVSDQNDPFPLDPANGRGTALPVSYEWENDSEPAGFLYNLGFSGLMNNGVSDYLDLYSLSNMTTGGAAGVLTIDSIAAGDPVASVNNQSYGFQFGVDVAPSDEPFTVHTRLLLPFAGADLGGHQSMGFFIGTGDQDNYIKLVVNASMATGGLQFAAERTGKFEQVANVAAPVLGQSQVDLYLRVDPGDLSVRAFYQAGEDTTLVEVGTATTFPEAWLTADTALAVGIISTSFGGPTFGATWDFLRVTYGMPGSIDLSHEQDPVVDETGNDTVVQAAVDGVIVIDAEHPIENIGAAGHQWVSGGGEGARSDASMVASPDSGLIRFGNSDTPHLRYSVNFPSAGDWYVWVRGWGDAVGNEGKSDSVHVGINGKLSTAKGIQGFPAGDWQWSNSQRGGGLAMIRVDSPGEHIIDVWMREDGFELDALLLTLDGSYMPVGQGPEAEQSDDATDDTGNGSETGSDVSSGSGTEEGNETSEEAAGSGDNGDGENSNANEVHTDVDGVIAVEAEHPVESIGAAGRQWVGGNREGARGNASMVASPDSGLIRFGNSDTPHLRYSVNFPSAGDWYVWVRGWGDAVGNEGKSDSVHVGINGKLSTAKGIQGFPAGDWQWSNSQRGGGLAMIRVDSPGKHTIDVWMREDGFELDALLLTLDGSYVPGGQGLDEQQEGDTTDNTDIDNEDGSDGESNVESGGDTGTEGHDNTVNNGGGDSANNSVDNNIDDGVDAEDGVIVIETENFSSTMATGTHRWISGSKEGASGGGSMITTPDAGLLRANASDTPVMRYAVDFPAAGTWRVWVRGWGDAVSGEGKSDSVHVGIDGTLAGAKAIQGFPASGWTWSSTTRGGGFASVQVSSPGPRMIDVWMREDGLEVDALILTTDTAYLPVGLPGMPGKSGTGDTTDEVGIDTDTGTAAVYRAPASRNWISFSNSAGSATPRHEAGAVEFGGKLYLMGGRGSRPIDIYDPTTDAWSQGARAPVELHHFQPVVFNNKIWVLGAMTCCYPREDNVGDVWTYTPATDKWARGMAIPQSRQRGSAAAVVHDEKIYLIGGNTLGHDGGAVDWFDEFDPSTGIWRTLPDAPAARDHAQAGLVDNKLVLAAGRRSSQPNVFKDTIAQVDVFDFDTGRWSKGADIPTKRAGTMSVTVGREVLVIGGESAGRQAAHDSVEAYDIDTNDWRSLKPLRQGRHSGGAARLDNAVHVVAGAVTTGGANETASHERLPLD